MGESRWPHRGVKSLKSVCFCTDGRSSTLQLHTHVPPLHQALQKNVCLAFLKCGHVPLETVLIRMFYLCTDQTVEQVITNDGILENTCVWGVNWGRSC